MSATAAITFTTPVGRLVQGSLYKGSDKDAEGRPLVYKTGANAGQARLNFFFSLAVPKMGEAHWNQTAWGQKIIQAGRAFLPHAEQLPTFAWKVTDGDSQIPDKKGKRPCDREGFPGHWILKFSGSYAPKVYSLVGVRQGDRPNELPQEGAVPLGHYVQVNCNVQGNGSQSQPGVYLNHNMLCLIAYGTEIQVGMDVEDAGFGDGITLPAGASLTPPAGWAPPATQPPLPGAAVPPVAPPAAVQPPPAAVAPAPVTPPMPPAAPAFRQPPTPPAGPRKVMTAAAQGVSYESYVAAGWTDEQMLQSGVLQIVQ